jgi:hypothetical protein
MNRVILLVIYYEDKTLGGVFDAQRFSRQWTFRLDIDEIAM